MIAVSADALDCGLAAAALLAVILQALGWLG